MKSGTGVKPTTPVFLPPRAAQAADLLAAEGGVLGLRLRVTAYPEGLASVWLMLAARSPQEPR